MPPFSVLHVCMGNICRSPMAERLLVLAVRDRLVRRGLDPAGADELVYSHSAGTG
ncbi:phosphotyrosine protein phosphatase, partial [Micromonospora azadirachtae]